MILLFSISWLSWCSKTSCFTFAMLHLLDTVCRTCCLAFLFITKFCQFTSKILVCIFLHDKCGECFLQSLHDRLQGYEPLVVWRILRWQERQFNHPLVTLNLLEVLILLDDTGVLLVVVPIAAALQQFRIELGVELFGVP